MGHSEGFLKLVNEAKSNIKEYTIDEVSQKLQNNETFVFIDVREESEWQKGRAKNAIHIGKGVIERDIESNVPDKSTEVVLYCGGGFRSALAADALNKMGYQNVFSMDGGMRGWLAAGLPTEE